MNDSFASIWQLPIFCKFYGRLIPESPNAEGYFNKFHTYSKDDDDEIYVAFNDELQPMKMLEMLALASTMYVIGHGEAWSGWGKTYYKKYTLFSKEQLTKLYDKTIHFRYGDNLDGLFLSGQAQIFNKEDYLKNTPVVEEQGDIDLPFGDSPSPDMPF